MQCCCCTSDKIIKNVIVTGDISIRKERLAALRRHAVESKSCQETSHTPPPKILAISPEIRDSGKAADGWSRCIYISAQELCDASTGSGFSAVQPHHSMPRPVIQLLGRVSNKSSPEQMRKVTDLKGFTEVCSSDQPKYINHTN